MARFTSKQQAFIDHYLICLNATAAAKRARYKGANDNVFASIGSENLRKPKIRQEIERRLSELTMSANEVLHRLGEQARGSLEHFVRFEDDGTFWVDLDKARDAGVLHLVKEVKQEKKDFYYDSGESETTYRTMVKLYDAQNALRIILEHHQKAGSGPQEHVVMSLAEWKEEAERRRQEVEETMTLFEEEE